MNEDPKTDDEPELSAREQHSRMMTETVPDPKTREPTTAHELHRKWNGS